MENVQTKNPEPPRATYYLAVLIELGFIGVFIYHRSWTGIVLWLAYLWFSALWSFVEQVCERRD